MPHNNEYFNPLINHEEPEALKIHRERNKKIADEVEEFQRLCWEIFIVSDAGKKLYGMLLHTFVIPAMYKPSDANVNELALYWEGFKSAIRGLQDNALEHQKRILKA